MIQINHRDNSLGTGSDAETGRTAGTLGIADTGGLRLPAGPAAERPTGAERVPGTIRFETGTNRIEYWDGTAWVQVATGGGFVEDLRGSVFGNPIVDGVDSGGAAPADLHYLRVSNSDGGGVTVETVGSIPARLDLRAHGSGTVTLGNAAAGGVLQVGGTAVGDSLTVTGAALGVTLTTALGDLQFAPAGLIDAGGNWLRNLLDPVDPTDAATKRYVDSVASGLFWKAPVRAASASAAEMTGWLYNPGAESGSTPLVWTNVLSAPVLDGVTVANGDRVLIKDAPDPRGNGIFVYDSAAQGLRRADDADNSPGSEVRGGISVFVTEGATQADSGWTLSSPDDVAVLGTDTLVWTQFSDAGLVAGAGLSRSGNVLDVNVSGVTTAIASDTVIVSSSGTAGQVLTSTGTAGQEAVWGTVDLANPAAVTGVLGVPNGGTGISSFTAGDMIVATGPTTLAGLAIGPASTAGQATVLRVNTAGTAPEWSPLVLDNLADVDVATPVNGQVLLYDGAAPGWRAGAVDLADANAVTGVLGASNGGIGLSAVAPGSVLYGTGGPTLGEATNPGATTASQAWVLTSGSGSDAVFAPLNLDQLADVSAGGAAAGDVLTFDGTAWTAAPSSNFDRLVAVSAADTTPDTLDAKILAGAGIATAIVNPGADEDLQVSVATDGMTLVFDGSNQLAVGGGTADQVLVSQGAGTPAVWSWLDVLRNAAGDIAVRAASPAGAVNLLAVSGSGAGGQSVTLQPEGADSNIYLDLAPKGGGRIRLSGVAWPGGGVPQYSVLVTQGTAGDLQVVSAPTGGGDLVLTYDDAGGAIVWRGLSAVGTSFSTWQFIGNAAGSTSIVADTGSDTVTFEAGDGIRITGDAAADKLRLDLRPDGLVDTFATAIDDRLIFFDTSAADQPRLRSFQDLFADLDVVTAASAGQGLLVKLADDSYTSRTLQVDTAADRAGLAVTDGDGVAGNPTVGLDIENLTLGTTPLAGTDRLVLYDPVADVNRAISGSDLASGVASLVALDRTAIFDGADAASSTVVVDTDRTAGVIDFIADNGGSGVKVGEWAYLAGAGRLRLAPGTGPVRDDTRLIAGNAGGWGGSATADIDLRLVTGGAGVVVLDRGSGTPTLATDPGADLEITAGDEGGGTVGGVTVRAGDGSTQPGGHVVLRAGDSTSARAGRIFLDLGAGTPGWDSAVMVRDGTDEVFKFWRNTTITVRMANAVPTSLYQHILFEGTTASTSAVTLVDRLGSNTVYIQDNTANFLEARFVGRDTVSLEASVIVVEAVVTKGTTASSLTLVTSRKDVFARQAATVDATLIADTALGHVRLEVTGVAGRTLDWTCYVTLTIRGG